MATRTRKDSKDTWDSGSLDPTDRSKGSGVASTNFFLFLRGARRTFICYDTLRKLRRRKK